MAHSHVFRGSEAIFTEATTIRISTGTRDDLKQLGFKDETYEEILKRLIKQARLLTVYEREKRILDTEEFAPLG